MQPAFDEVNAHLRRLNATEVRVALDASFEPQTGILLKIEYQGAQWHMLPQDFRNMLGAMPDQAGAEAVRKAIETDVAHVWHGPAPTGSRDTSY